MRCIMYVVLVQQTKWITISSQAKYKGVTTERCKGPIERY